MIARTLQKFPIFRLSLLAAVLWPVTSDAAELLVFGKRAALRAVNYAAGLVARQAGETSQQQADDAIRAGWKLAAGAANRQSLESTFHQNRAAAQLRHLQQSPASRTESVVPEHAQVGALPHQRHQPARSLEPPGTGRRQEP